MKLCSISFSHIFSFSCYYVSCSLLIMLIIKPLAGLYLLLLFAGQWCIFVHVYLLNLNTPEVVHYAKLAELEIPILLTVSDVKLTGAADHVAMQTVSTKTKPDQHHVPSRSKFVQLFKFIT